MMMIAALMALCLSGAAMARSSLSACPAVTTAPNFDIQKYMGQWYENRKYHANFEGQSKCVIAHYSRVAEDRIHVVNSYISGVTGQPSTIESNLRIPDLNDAARMKIRYDSMPPGVEGDYFVLGTDYSEYAVVYSCSERGSKATKFAWILTREKNPPQSVIDSALVVFASNNIDTNELQETEQNDC